MCSILPFMGVGAALMGKATMKSSSWEMDGGWVVGWLVGWGDASMFDLLQVMVGLMSQLI